MQRRRIVTLLTDFGDHDYYVAAVKGVLLSLAPRARIVDLTHSVPPGDVEHAAFLLAAAWREFPHDTVHLAVIDPEVGSDRLRLAVRLDRQFVVAPDNGLISLALPLARDSEVRSITHPDLERTRMGATFDGRDRFAPAAAYLARGEAFSDLGAPVPDFRALNVPPPELLDLSCRGRVRHIDRFGNLVTDIPTGWLPGEGFGAAIGTHRIVRFATHYAELEPGEPALVPGSLGTLEISLNGENLADHWGVRRGERIEIEFGYND